MSARRSTTIDCLAEDYIATLARLSPIEATDMGIVGFDDQLDDFSPEGYAARAEAASQTLLALQAADPVDDTDEVTIAAMGERLGLCIELYEASEHLRDVNVIASPLQSVRRVFDIMPTDTLADWEVISHRLAAVPDAIDGYMASLREGAHRGLTPALRQLERASDQADHLAGAGSFWSWLAAEATADGADLPETLTGELHRHARDAAAAYGDLTHALRQLAPGAPNDDAFGRDRYALHSRHFLGAQVDLEDAYAWGIDELHSITTEQASVAVEIGGPGTSIEAAIEILEGDPARHISGTEDLQAWMQSTSDEAMAALAGRHFDIPEPVRTLTCRIAPTTNGIMYYTGPSEDFSRPGTMWWSVPAGVTSFGTWREKTTVYHEGVPGHHLQMAHTVFRSELLNRWRRLACWVSGTGEGWALYAERLMASLGFLDDPGDRMGMLDAQRMRTARVVLDIGVHLRLACPREWGGGTWDADKAWDFLRANSNEPEEFLSFELDRYLGWAGQAPAYKIGQRLWEDIRDESLAAGSDLKTFHARALDVGAVGLDVLREALAPRPPAG
ncbi:MAG: DUF885 domain-containing protein [Arachnia sp.]